MVETFAKSPQNPLGEGEAVSEVRLKAG